MTTQGINLLRPAKLLHWFPEFRTAVNRAASAPQGDVVTVFRSMTSQSRDFRNAMGDRCASIHSALGDNAFEEELSGLLTEGELLSMFANRGRQTFAIGAGVVEEMEKTDLGDVRVDDVACPYEFFFLAFPATRGSDSLWVEGVYVWDSPRALTVVVCLSPGAESPVWSMKNTVFVRLPKNAGCTVANGVILSHQYFANVPANEVADRQHVWVEFQKRLLGEFKDILQPAVDLAAKLLCLISAAPDLMATSRVWNATGSPFAQKGARAHYQRGELPVRRIVLPQRMVETHGSDIHGQGVAPRAHWRRGHFARRRHGKGRELVRVVWIRPTLVNASAGPVASESIYEVRK